MWNLFKNPYKLIMAAANWGKYIKKGAKKIFTNEMKWYIFVSEWEKSAFLHWNLWRVIY